ncbi:MAG: hypothetical protein EBR09_07470 [Proteobacteria bacterium]|jgi:hypothetical protein|nr:hypothetical protein [Pseudomonadota bacterium]
MATPFQYDSAAMGKLMQRLSNLKRMDMKTSTDIAALANSRVRDTNGNLLPSVWTRRSVNNEQDNATLLTRDALQKHLQAFLDKNIETNSAMLVKLADPGLLVDWVVKTAELWEHRYALKRDEKFDISHGIESAMSEVVLEHVLPLLKNYQNFKEVEEKLEQNMRELRRDPNANKWARVLLRHISQDRSSIEDQAQEMTFWLHRGNHALTRLLFRLDTTTELRDRMCLLASKLFQKKETCERQGVYASQRQRSDIVQLYNNTVLSFREFVRQMPSGRFEAEALERLDREDWIFLVVDHTAVPVTLADVQAPVPHAEDNETSCPTCGAAIALGATARLPEDPHKRMRL